MTGFHVDGDAELLAQLDAAYKAELARLKAALALESDAKKRQTLVACIHECKAQYQRELRRISECLF